VPCRIYCGWIKSGYLKYESSSGGKKHFLVKSEVDTLLFYELDRDKAEEAMMLGDIPRGYYRDTRGIQTMKQNDPYDH
jgi:hypothetical protein